MSYFKECAQCVPPRRHPGCHQTCPDYIEDKERHDKIMQRHKRKKDLDRPTYHGIKK